MMEQQGALLKRLAEADSEKAVGGAPLLVPGGHPEKAAGAEWRQEGRTPTQTFLWVLVSRSVKRAGVPCPTCFTGLV